MIGIVLADNHDIVRSSLRALLEAEPDFRIIGETGDGLEAARLAKSLQPDILVLDLMMSGVNGFEITRQVSKHSPKTGVVILSSHSDESYVLEALQAGAKAYVPKESTSAELMRAIREVIAGHRYLGSPLSERALETYMQKTEANILDPYDTLTSVEREVLQLMAEGMTTKEVASSLNIDGKTVATHREHIMRKLNIRNVVELAKYAVRAGLTSFDLVDE